MPQQPTLTVKEVFDMAALVRWNPWGDLFSLQSQMDQLFQAMSGNAETAPGETDRYNLPVDIRQTDEAFIIEASVPGFAPEDVEVTVESNVLTIKGTHRTESESNAGGYVRRERRTGSMYRQIALPAEVRSEDITASFTNGVLAVTVPRVQKAAPKRIPVSAGSSANGQGTVVDGEATAHHSADTAA
ncbi:MAG: Hsp20/alpha crystallin family protein [Candidatus Dormibacteria bacterium]